MDGAYISGLSALAGSAVGALSSFATTWLTQNSKYRTDRMDREGARREALYGAFIDEVSKLFADAVLNDMKDTTKLVKIYSLISRMRLFASAGIIGAAEDVMQRLAETYNAPNLRIEELRSVRFDEIDPLKQFSEICRRELSSL